MNEKTDIKNNEIIFSDFEEVITESNNLFSIIAIPDDSSKDVFLDIFQNTVGNIKRNYLMIKISSRHKFNIEKIIKQGGMIITDIKEAKLGGNLKEIIV